MVLFSPQAFVWKMECTKSTWEMGGDQDGGINKLEVKHKTCNCTVKKDSPHDKMLLCFSNP